MLFFVVCVEMDSVDTIVALDVVLANGTIVTASGTSNADLFFVSAHLRISLI